MSTSGKGATGKVRVHELAKELGLENKVLIQTLAELGIPVKTHSSSIDDDDVARVKSHLANPAEEPAGEKRIQRKGLTVIRRRAAKPSEEAQAPGEAPPEETGGIPATQAEEASGMHAESPLIAPEADGEMSATLEPEEAEPVMPPPAEAAEISAEVAGPEPVAAGSLAAAGIAAPATIGGSATVPSKAATAQHPAQPAVRETAGGARLGAAKVLGRLDAERIWARSRSLGTSSSPAPAAPKAEPGAATPAAVPPRGEKRAEEEKPARRRVEFKRKREEVRFEGTDERDRLFRIGPRRRRAVRKVARKTEITTPKAIKRVIRLAEGITVAELAKRMGVKSGEVLKHLMEMGQPMTLNQVLDVDTAALVAGDFQYEVERVNLEAEDLQDKVEEKPEDLVLKAPVITIMGHVDHGKTSILDAIRETNVTGGEAGGITQHIGAYQVPVDGRHVVFLDTPGHEAFTALRARGASITDIVVLVVAANDGVMPQTVEAINHARAADVPIVVAINKIDLPEANPDRVKKQLGDYGLVPEAWGGTTIFAEVSAKKKVGLKELLELILLQAEVLELRANPSQPARGTVIESRLDRGRGPIATVLVQEGTLRAGDTLLSGTQLGKVRALLNDHGAKVEEAGPATPVEVLGLSGVPEAGEEFLVVADETRARQLVEQRLRKQREQDLGKSSRMSLEQLYEKIRLGETKEVRIVLKADVQGSVEAVTDSLQRLSTAAVGLKVIHGGVGGISESDVMLAEVSNGIVVGFNVRPDPKSATLAELHGVDMRLYTIIYELLDDVRNAMEGMLEPTLKEKIVGRAEVRNTFGVPRIGTIAGLYVLDGTVSRSASARLVRDHKPVWTGKVGSLRRFKDDVREVAAGYECGMGLEGFNDVKIGDIIECFVMEEHATKLVY